MTEPLRYFSTSTVAKALGVSVSTVKRWVEDGDLPACRTVGKHRRILGSDVLRLVRREQWPHVDLGLLGESGQDQPPPATESMADQLYQHLVEGDVETSSILIQDCYQRGLRMDRLADEVVAPAMHRIGHGWECGELDVWQEHRGTQVCLHALLGLKQQLEKNIDPGRPVALGGGPEYDHYTLANLLVEMLLLDHGWRVIPIGPNTPMGSFRRALKEFRPHLMWISCSYLPDPHQFRREYQELYEEAESDGVAVALGGQALAESPLEDLPCTIRANELSDLSTLVRDWSRSDRQRQPSQAGN